jgi:hypothetical protein
MCQGEFQTTLNMPGDQAAGFGCITLFEGSKNGAMNFIGLFHQFLIMAEPFDTKDPGMDMAVACQLG